MTGDRKVHSMSPLETGAYLTAIPLIEGRGWPWARAPHKTRKVMALKLTLHCWGLPMGACQWEGKEGPLVQQQHPDKHREMLGFSPLEWGGVPGLWPGLCVRQNFGELGEWTCFGFGE